MKISFAILCYNYGRYLAQAINSCLCQEASGFETETLVIDDGSTDSTPEICAQFQGRIRVIRGPNEGFGASLTKAVTESRGDYVCLLDADDYFEVDKLATVSPLFGSGIPLIIGGNYFVDEKGDMMQHAPQQGGNTSTLCVRKDAALPLIPVENEISFHAILRAGKGVYLPEARTYYRVHEKSMTNRTVAGKWNTYLAGVTHRLANQIGGFSPEKVYWIDSMHQVRKIANGFRAQAYYNELEAALELGRRLSAYRALLKMLSKEVAAMHHVSRLGLKMICRTIFMRPTFPKGEGGD
jgi:glycosyltransferase involved in cell wall biosynthesis